MPQNMFKCILEKRTPFNETSIYAHLMQSEIQPFFCMAWGQARTAKVDRRVLLARSKFWRNRASPSSELRS